MPNGLIDPLIEFPGAKSSFIRDPNENKELINPFRFEAKEKDFESKIYLILYVINGEDDDISSKTFSVCIGRTMAYRDIKDKLISGVDVDVHSSKVITETRQNLASGDIKYFLMPYEECISVYAFCTSIAHMYEDDDFSIEDYSSGEVPEDAGPKENTYMTSDQKEYYDMLKESINRKQIWEGLKQFNQDESNNV